MTKRSSGALRYIASTEAGAALVSTTFGSPTFPRAREPVAQDVAEVIRKLSTTMHETSCARCSSYDRRAPITAYATLVSSDNAYLFGVETLICSIAGAQARAGERCHLSQKLFAIFAHRG